MARTPLLALAVLFVAARLFTGIVYERDDPTTYLVLKHAPSLAIAQENAADTPMRERFTILDGGENELAYQPAYEAAMGAAPWIAAGCALLVLLPRGRRRARRSGLR